jgi:hypothetical protein
MPPRAVLAVLVTVTVELLKALAGPLIPPMRTEPGDPHAFIVVAVPPGHPLRFCRVTPLLWAIESAADATAGNAAIKAVTDASTHTSRPIRQIRRRYESPVDPLVIAASACVTAFAVFFGATVECWSARPAICGDQSPAKP